MPLPDLRNFPAAQQQTVSEPFVEAVDIMLRNIDSQLDAAQRFAALIAVYESVVRQCRDPHVPLLAALATLWQTADSRYSPVTAYCAACWRMRHAARSADVDAVETALQALQARAAPAQLTEQQATLIRLWGHNALTLAYALNADRRMQTEDAAKAVDAIAAPFAGQAPFERERAEAWRNVAYARSQLAEQRAQTEQAAEVVDTIAAPFAGQAPFERERADARLYVAYAERGLGRSDAAVRQLKHSLTIAARFNNSEQAAEFAEVVHSRTRRCASWASTWIAFKAPRRGLNAIGCPRRRVRRSPPRATPVRSWAASMSVPTT